MKYFLITTLIICGYGLLPISCNFINYFKKDTLIISNDENERDCIYMDAHITEGGLIIPSSIFKSGFKIDSFDINLAGDDPFKYYDSTFRLQEMIVRGNVISLDKTFCDSSSFSFAPKFYVESWSTKNYYPRFKTYSNIFMYVFFACSIYSLVTILFFIFWLFLKVFKKGRR